jgi:two-component system, cell cycle sensor histidine kinase and response regulator CckA
MRVRPDQAARRPGPPGLRAAHPDAPEARTPTILIAGVVHFVDQLQHVAEIERARLRGVLLSAVRDAPDAIVVGTVSPASVAPEVIGELKRHERAGPIPVLHIVQQGTSCGACGAELCLASGDEASTLVSAVRLLLRLRRAEREREREVPATDERLLALGRLAGGIVHDFNNLLLVMTGHVELVRRLLGEGHPAAVRLAPVLHAAERAAALTRQLLALGRASPADAPSADVGAVLAQLEPMLRRLLGAYLRLEVRAGRGLAPVRADPSQVEQLLLNLVLNARDAMPGGGRLTVETQDVEVAGGTAPQAPPGRYVMIAVSDEGIGMDPATRARVFEPFFTTKPAGEGSGLGLASVHHVVEQAGGTVVVDSQPGVGSTFRVYLPCAAERSERVALAQDGPVPRGRETVLVAEGSEPVREISRELLEELGYRVLTASCADEALRLAREWAAPIDVVVADAAMPGESGGALRDQLLALRPRTRVLLASGSGEGALPKPFSRGRLARAIREALDTSRA